MLGESIKAVITREVYSPPIKPLVALAVEILISGRPGGKSH